MNRFGRILVWTAGAIGVLSASVYMAAIQNMNRERRARHYLGDRLYTEECGSGDPIVFLTGLQGSTRYWADDFDSLASSHRLIFVDELGFGRSPWPADSEFTLDDQLGALRRTLVGLGATRDVTFVAHSFGTVLAAYYAARFPLEVKRLVLLGAPVFDSEAEARWRIRGMGALAAVFTFNRPLALVSCTLMCAFRPLLQRVLPRLAPDRRPEVVADSVLHDLGSVDGSVEILLHHPIRQPILALGSRVTFIHGDRDNVTALTKVQALARSSGARLVPVESDHSNYTSRARKVIVEEVIRK
ncbi:MAG: alpha/beta fold hydrolase [Acidobacteriota bacterium]